MENNKTIYCVLELDTFSKNDTFYFKDISFEILTEAEKLKTEFKGLLVGILVTNKYVNEETLKPLAGYNLDSLYIYKYTQVDYYYYLDTIRNIFFEKINNKDLFVIMIGDNIVGSDIGVTLSSCLNIMYISGNVDISYSNSSNIVDLVRPIIGGKVYANNSVVFSNPLVLSIKAGSIGFLNNKKETYSFNKVCLDVFNPANNSVKELGILKGDPSSIDLTEADYVVGIGKGVIEANCLNEVMDFVKFIGASYGCTRPLVDMGIFPLSKQIGITGKIISPKYYIALGISGTEHHVMGIKESKNIVAVNKDKTAPIFKAADVAFCGDLKDLIPEIKNKILI